MFRSALPWTGTPKGSSDHHHHQHGAIPPRAHINNRSRQSLPCLAVMATDCENIFKGLKMPSSSTTTAAGTTTVYIVFLRAKKKENTRLPAGGRQSEAQRCSLQTGAENEQKQK